MKEIEGVGPAYHASPAKTDGISEALILKWVHHADLFRIRGVAGQYVELLEAAGVDTVVELAYDHCSRSWHPRSDAERLHASAWANLEDAGQQPGTPWPRSRVKPSGDCGSKHR